MTREEAIRILDPETSRDALMAYAQDRDLMLAKTDEACRVAAEAMRELEKRQWISVEEQLPEDHDDVLI